MCADRHGAGLNFIDFIIVSPVVSYFDRGWRWVANPTRFKFLDGGAADACDTA